MLMGRVFLECGSSTTQLPEGTVYVGRGLSCAIRFNDPGVSRRHLRFNVSAAGGFVEDAGSRNGSQLNGQPLTEPTRVSDGDVLQIGFRRLKVLVVEDTEAPWADEETHDRGILAAKPVTGETAEPPQHPTPGAGESIRVPDAGYAVTCPRCRLTVGSSERNCPSCGYRFPAGRPMSVTQEMPVINLERRRELRRHVDIPVIYTSATLTVDALARDLSRGGMFVVSDVLDATGTDCIVTMLPDGVPAMAVAGIVCHVVPPELEEARRPQGFGVKFTLLSPDVQRWLDEFLSLPAPG